MAVHFSRVVNNHAYRSIVDQVCDAMLRGDLRKGDWLPSERVLVEQTGLSRSSVRQAIEVLTEAGVVVVKPGGGGGAQMVNDMVPTELLGQVLSTSTQHLIEVCEVRTIIEVSAAQLAVARATEAQIAELETIVEQTEATFRADPPNKQRWLQLDLAFHQAILKMAGNDFLVRTYNSIFRRLLQIADMAMMSEFEIFGPPTMRHCVEAFRRRDLMGVQIALYEHIGPSSRILVRYGRAETTAAEAEPVAHEAATVEVEGTC